jgi:integrase
LRSRLNEGSSLPSGKPEEGWVWPAPTKAGHINHSTVKKQHRAALKLSNVRPFVLYSLRHTFLTRLEERHVVILGRLARIAGHSSIAISSRYVHPSENSVLDAMERMGGHKTGHGDEDAILEVQPPQRIIW